ncbi:MAG: hypothetical protein ACOY93_20385 [Bacillota bacterium]
MTQYRRRAVRAIRSCTSTATPAMVTSMTAVCTRTMAAALPPPGWFSTSGVSISPLPWEVAPRKDQSASSQPPIRRLPQLRWRYQRKSR